MSIQSNVNQIISSIGIMGGIYKTTPEYKTRVEGKAMQAKMEEDIGSLKDIAANIAGGKEYSETELKNIEGRVAKQVENIYSTKIAGEQNPTLSKYVKSDTIKHPEIKKLTEQIESGIAARREKLAQAKADESLLSSAEQKLYQKQQMRNYRETIANTHPMSKYAIEKEERDGSR